METDRRQDDPAFERLMEEGIGRRETVASRIHGMVPRDKSIIRRHEMFNRRCRLLMARQYTEPPPAENRNFRREVGRVGDWPVEKPSGPLNNASLARFAKGRGWSFLSRDIP
jgi:hypothetical protein